MNPLARYYGFALASMGANLGTQHAAYLTSPIAPVQVSIVAGTIVGFAFKYLMDKYYVFAARTESATAEARRVVLYGMFSVGTTVLFWSVEIAFWLVFRTDAWRYFGGLLGLMAGYTLKFWLDRRFVFHERLRP
jgi:putative flippase GtrA